MLTFRYLGQDGESDQHFNEPQNQVVERSNLALKQLDHPLVQLYVYIFVAGSQRYSRSDQILERGDLCSILRQKLPYYTTERTFYNHSLLGENAITVP